jgi:hypothetical protein
MKKDINNLLIMCLLIMIIMPIIFFGILPALREHTLHKKQDELAKTLGGQIEDYPYPDSFPIGYFHSILEAGATYEEVHSIVRGYDAVYHCEDDFNYEIYYYFSLDENYSTIILISYDEQKMYEGMQASSDPNSRTLGGHACGEGPLK